MSDDPTPETSRAGRRRRWLWICGAAFAAVVSLYVADLVITSSKVPRGVTAAGVPLGGLTPVEAEQRLEEQIGPRQQQPVRVTLGELKTSIDPREVGVTADLSATVAQAGGQPLNPFTRFASLFATTPVGVVTTVDQPALTAVLEGLGAEVAEEPVEGSITFARGEPVISDPRSGQRLDVPAAAAAFTERWASGTIIDLPMETIRPETTAADVADAADSLATPAVSGPVTVVGDNGVRGVVTEDVIAKALSFRPEKGELVPEIDESVVIDALRPQLAPSEVPGRNADIDFAADPPVAMPAQGGRRVDYPATLRDLQTVLGKTDDRELTAAYIDSKPSFTTEQLDRLGPVEVIGEFQTSGFAGDSGRNIRRAAEQINGMVVRPGETFSLNGATNPRNAAAGYVEAGIINNGRPARGVGGGVSQVATTLFNAAYFAGMEIIEHQEHSYYISRYPAGREATVYGDELDVKFRNDGPTSVQIRTEWTPSSITIRILGIKRYDVTSEQSGRSAATSPPTVTVPAGESCSASGGGSGFTVTDTRTLRDVTTGATRSESHTVVYDPIPRVVCGG